MYEKYQGFKSEKASKEADPKKYVSNNYEAGFKREPKVSIFSYGFQPASFSPIPTSLDRQHNSITPVLSKRGPINISFNPPPKEQSNRPKIAFPGFLPFRY